MTDVLDELREAVIATANEKADDASGAWMPVTDWLKLLDAFAEDHPGLVDASGRCDFCGRLVPTVTILAYDDGWPMYGCPACAEEAGHEA